MHCLLLSLTRNYITMFTKIKLNIKVVATKAGKKLKLNILNH